jgi:hypothetical protein
MLLCQVQNGFPSAHISSTVSLFPKSDFTYFIAENKLSQVHAAEKIVNGATEMFFKIQDVASSVFQAPVNSFSTLIFVPSLGLAKCLFNFYSTLS